MKNTLLFLIVALFLPGAFLLDGAKGEENVLLASATRGEEKVRGAAEEEEKLPEELLKEIEPAPKRREKEDLDIVLSGLLEEVSSLKTKVVVSTHSARATEAPKEKKNIGSKTLYTYKEGAIFEIHAGVDRVTDIELGFGEYLTSPPVAGDTARWKVSVLESERVGGKMTHVIIKPIEEDIETNLILATNRNVYHLRLQASDWYMPAVSWTYPEEEARALEAANARKRKEEILSVTPEKLNFGYEIEESDVAFRPVQVFDDGEKTYIKMPSSLSTTEAPALFLLDEESSPMLVNYRVKGEFYIVDRLFSRAELRVGKTEAVQIRSEKDRRTFLERLF